MATELPSTPLAVNVTREGSGIIRMPLKAGAEETYVTTYLPRTTRSLRLLSLEISAEGLYRFYDADHGVVAGRVIANDGVGVPNCRISLFLPKNAAETTSGALAEWAQRLRDELYPYETINDQDGARRRYNLLPSQTRNRGFNNFPANDLGFGASPKTPVGSFPEKEEVVANPIFLDVYQRYYRFSTVTNASGDYLIPGVPVGAYTVHMDADVTDIGPWSMPPAVLTQVLGYPAGSFDDDGLRVRPSPDLDNMPHLVRTDNPITVRPLWSQRRNPDDTNGGKIGITRHDIRFPVHIQPTTTLAGAVVGMNSGSWWGDRVIFRLHYGFRSLCFGFGSCEASCENLISVKWDLGFNWSFSFSDGLDISFDPCLNIRLNKVIPYLRLELQSNYCRLGGGRFDTDTTGVIYHDRSCACSAEEALQEFSTDGITDSIDLSNHRPEELGSNEGSLDGGITIYELDPQAVTDDDAEVIRQEIEEHGSLARLSVGGSLVTDRNEAASYLLRRRSGFAKLVDPGQFALLIPTTRRRMITSENGELVDTPDDNRGVFTEWRGAIELRGTRGLSNPASRDRVGRLAMRFPQYFDYAANNGDSTAAWLLQHARLTVGKIYTVSQLISARNSDFDADQERAFDINSTENDVPYFYQGGGSLTNAVVGVMTGGLARVGFGKFLGILPADNTWQNAGWENQTGLILSPEPLDTGAWPALNWRSAMPANHFTDVGTDDDNNMVDQDDPRPDSDLPPYIPFTDASGYDSQSCTGASPSPTSQPTRYPDDAVDATNPYPALMTAKNLTVSRIVFEDTSAPDSDPLSARFKKQNVRFSGFEDTDGLFKYVPYTLSQPNGGASVLDPAEGSAELQYWHSQLDNRYIIRVGDFDNRRTMRLEYQFLGDSDEFGRYGLLPRVVLEFVSFGILTGRNGQAQRITYNIGRMDVPDPGVNQPLTGVFERSLSFCDGFWVNARVSPNEAIAVDAQTNRLGLRGYFRLYDRDFPSENYWISPEFVFLDVVDPQGSSADLDVEPNPPLTTSTGYYRLGTDSFTVDELKITSSFNPGPYNLVSSSYRVQNANYQGTSNTLLITNQDGISSVSNFVIDANYTLEIRAVYTLSYNFGMVTTRLAEAQRSYAFTYPYYQQVSTTGAGELPSGLPIVAPVTSTTQLAQTVAVGDIVHLFIPTTGLATGVYLSDGTNVTGLWSQELILRGEGTHPDVSYLHLYTTVPAAVAGPVAVRVVF